MKSAEQAVNDFMMMFTGLYKPEVKLHHQLKFVRERTIVNIEPRANKNCFDCSNSERSRRGKGVTPEAFSFANRHRLPCRIAQR
ncbi:MAG: hypothetical protein WBA41_22360 [Rivularia sp. (in: cyanobacteria)]